MSTQTVAFFGATGDCAGFCLAAALNAGYTCTALARTPSKLRSSLDSKGVSSEIIDSRLTIVQGDVKDVSAVRRTLSSTPDGRVVDKIVSGIGGTPVLQWSLSRPLTMTDPKICSDACSTILRALKDLQTDQRPMFIVVSTTGIPPKGSPRDVPLLCVPLYRWLIAGPHIDKAAMEEELRAQVDLPEGESVISAFVAVKPSLLMDGSGHKKGLGAVRVGVDEKPEVGYSIQRHDVGRWMFEELVNKELRAEWRNKGLSMTY